MLASVSWQVFSLGLFAILCAEFAWRVRRVWEEDLSHIVGFVELRRTLRFRVFLCALGLATLTVVVRSVFRCAELAEGFRGKLANQQVIFMVLEGAMIVIAVGILTIWHPGLAFHERWEEAGWSLRVRRFDGRKVVVQGGMGRDWPISNCREIAVDRIVKEPPKRHIGHELNQGSLTSLLDCVCS